MDEATRPARSAHGYRCANKELASEQIIRSVQLGLVIKELPIEYRPRIGRSKLSPPADGIRHLRLLVGSALGASRTPLRKSRP